MSVWLLTWQQSVFKRYHSSKRFWEFYPQDGGENQPAYIWIEIASPYVYLQQPRLRVRVDQNNAPMDQLATWQATTEKHRCR